MSKNLNKYADGIANQNLYLQGLQKLKIHKYVEESLNSTKNMQLIFQHSEFQIILKINK